MSIADGQPVNAAASNAAFVSRSSTQTVGGVKTFTDTTESTNKNSGSIILEGGLGVEKNINSGGDVAAVNLIADDSLILSGSTSGAIDFKAPAIVNSHSLIYPATQGVSESYLKNDGSGNLSWQTISGVSPEEPLIEINKNGLTTTPYFISTFEELHEYDLTNNIIDNLI